MSAAARELVKRFPLPWRVEVDYGDVKVIDKAGQTVMCDMPYYPYFCIGEQDIKGLVDLMNTWVGSEQDI